MKANSWTNSSTTFKLAPGALVGAFLFLVWALSPTLTGRVEPWDADWPYYSTAILLAGLLVGIAFRRALLSAYIGAWVGQILALMTLPSVDRSWWYRGVLATAVGSLIILLGIAASTLLVALALRLSRRCS